MTIPLVILRHLNRDTHEACLVVREREKSELSHSMEGERGSAEERVQKTRSVVVALLLTSSVDLAEPLTL